MVAGVYTGASVLIPMTGLTVAPPVGQIPITPVHTATGVRRVHSSAHLGNCRPDRSHGDVHWVARLHRCRPIRHVIVVHRQRDQRGHQSGDRRRPDERLAHGHAIDDNHLHADGDERFRNRLTTGHHPVQNPHPPSIPPPGTGTASASFVRLDTTTQGNWKGSYGVEGYKLSNDATTLPSYAQVTINENDWLWDGNNADPRALQRSVGSSRFAGTWYTWSNMTVEVGLTDGESHEVALYAVDWDGLGRVEQIEVLDATTGVVLDTRTGTNFGGGHYWVWDIAGRVRFRITNTGPGNAVLSGVFIGASNPGASTPCWQWHCDIRADGYDDPRHLEGRVRCGGL